MSSSVWRDTGARQFDSDAAEAIGESAARSSVPRVRGAAALSTCEHELLSRLPHPPISAYRLPRMRRHARACCSAAWPNRRGLASERATGQTAEFEPESGILAKYDYRDRFGNLRKQVLRLPNDENGMKQFTQRRRVVGGWK